MNDYTYDPELDAWWAPNGTLVATEDLPGSSVTNTPSTTTGTDWFSSINKFGQTAAQIIGLSKGKKTATAPGTPAASQTPKWLVPVALGVGVLVILFAFLRK